MGVDTDPRNTSSASAPRYGCRMTTDQIKSGKRTLVGRVVSDKMDKTVVVEVVRRVQERRYKKYINRSRRFSAHDESNACQVNDVVVIQESRPLSRTKRWVVIERRGGADDAALSDDTEVQVG